MVMHATTKYLGGHSDVLGGVVVSRRDDEAFAQVRHGAALRRRGAVAVRLLAGACAACRTLPYRMRAHCANAMTVATFLAAHPKVSAVHYPGLPDNAFHALATRQMADFGGMLSFEVRGGKEAAMAVAARRRALHARDQPRRRREPDRAPRLDRRAGEPDAAGPAARLGRPRARRRPDRRPGAGA